jgi:hypothetical protein
MRTSIRTRLTMIFVVLAIGPLLLVGGIIIWQSFLVQQQQAPDMQREVARRVATEVTAFQLARLVLQTESGDPYRVGLALAHALHTLHPALDTKSENLPLDCPHWPALQEMGYIESFRRIEMRLDLA